MSQEQGAGAGAATTSSKDGWSNVQVVAPHQARGPLPHGLRRSSSTHLRHPHSSGATSAAAEGAVAAADRDTSGREPPRLQSRRSASAERGGSWVSAPPTKPKAERWVPLPFPHRETHEEDEDDAEYPQGAPPPQDGGLGEVHPQARHMLRDHSGQMSPVQPPLGAVALADAQGGRGRIQVVTACEEHNRNMVWDVLSMALPGCQMHKHSEVIHLGAPPSALNRNNRSSFSAEPQEHGDVFVFDYGVVICWGLDRDAEHYIMGLLRPCQSKRIAPEEVQMETLALHYTADQPPHIQNDCITISRREARDHKVKLAISHALAQSSKLNVYEARVEQLVEKIKLLPESLAVHGEIRMSRQQMAKIKGQLIIRKSEVNLLSTVLDTPDFFWSAPDSLRALYDKVAEYCDLSSRAVLVNSRTELITTMLRIWSDHKEHHHLARLDLIVMILILVEVVIAAAEVAGFFIHSKRHG